MVRQYLDVISWKGEGSSSFDEDGNPIIIEGEIFSNENARYENFSKGGNHREFLNRNGEVVLATGVIYLKKTCGEIPDKFSMISVDCVNRPKPFKAEVLNVNYGQMNTTLHIRENVGN